MATLFTKLERGREVRMLQVLAPGGIRRTIRLDRVPQRAAERFRDKVEQLVACQRLNQSPDGDLVKWLKGLDDSVYAGLARAGLVDPRAGGVKALALGAFVARYIRGKQGAVSERTITLLEQTQARLIAQFGSATLLERITSDGAAEWREAMLGEGLSEATARLHTRNAKSIFNAAVDRELIVKNPFKRLPSAAIAADRDEYISVADAERVLASLSGTSGRLLFGLARFGGLRTPSETHALEWHHVDLERGRLEVFAPKTNSTRIVPIVPKLAELLREAHDVRDADTEYLLPRSRNNLHRGLHAAIKRAGLTRWPDLFQALRRAAETDFAAIAPQHAVSSWLGHGIAVSAKHYLQIPPELYDRAAGLSANSALHQALQHRTELSGTKRQIANQAKTRQLAGVV